MPTIAITGAAGAIGSTTAQVFADAGWTLALLDYGAENRAALEDAHPDAHVAAADLTDSDAARDAFDALADAAGGLDAVLAIAGGFAMQNAHEATDAEYNRMMNLNVCTLVNTARATLPHLTANDNSFFLGVSAPGGVNGQAQAALYAASKGAVAAYVKSLGAEYAAAGLRASVLYPMGIVDTPANREAMPDGDPSTWVAPQELAESMLHATTRSPRGHLPEMRVYAAGSQ